MAVMLFLKDGLNFFKKQNPKEVKKMVGDRKD
jgi:hypothetical protein